MAYRTPYWESRRMDEEKSAGRLAETAARKAGLTARARTAATPKEPVVTRRPATAPRAEAPYLPERLEEGRLGDIMRASPKELEAIYERMPETERPVHIIRGEEQSYFSPGTRQEYGDLRTAMAGFKQRPPETTAAGRLSLATSEYERGVKAEELGKQAQAIFGKYATMDATGEPILPPELKQAYDAAAVMSDKNPKGAVDLMEKAEVTYRQKQAESARLSLMSSEELDAERLRLIGGETKGMEAGTPTERLAPDKEPVSPAERRKTAAERLREAYEKETAAPILGAKTLGRISEAWKRRGESPYIEPPSGLRGYR